MAFQRDVLRPQLVRVDLQHRLHQRGHIDLIRHLGFAIEPQRLSRDMRNPFQLLLRKPQIVGSRSRHTGNPLRQKKQVADRLQRIVDLMCNRRGETRRSRKLLALAQNSCDLRS